MQPSYTAAYRQCMTAVFIFQGRTPWGEVTLGEVSLEDLHKKGNMIL